MVDPKSRLIFALDVTTRKEAERYVEELDGLVDFFKVGIILHTITGIEFVREIIKKGKKVFLDLKFYDIPETVRDAVKQVSLLGVDFLTVHAQRQVMEAAVEGKKSRSLKVIAVTLLTSMDASDVGIEKSPEEIIVQRAKMAAECGCDGVVASGKEAGVIKKETEGKLFVVCPGIRPAGYDTGLHKRQSTPYQAIRAGADYLVVGRPIRDAPSPRSAALSILEEMKSAFQKF
ncbi:MAG: orotidine-5'-phosphate decarboxylase [Candidatus Omnitrophica bacterium]|nr:orotidine-5'-phosphate decarboxylase [Candidatus Omnitrophota bacterium]MCM8777518.1 orotidine-5'-phosphate decarboxylase [Candidatus Omnitrophota bacterium]